MNQPHRVGISSLSQSAQAAMEAVDPKFVMEGLLKARQKTILGLVQIRDQLKEGMTEDDARRLALQIFSDMGVTKHWHRPFIRFGAGTALTFHDPIQLDYRLQPDDPYYIDLGPVWADPELGLEYEGDYGDTFVFGTNPEAEQCANTARTLFKEAQKLWKEEQATGEEMYRFLDKRSTELGYQLMEKVDGHRVGDFPHHKYTKERLSKLSFNPAATLWVLEVQVNHPSMGFGAFYEDLL